LIIGENKNMLDAKLLSWLLKGSLEYNEIMRSVDNDLLKAILLPEYKPVAEATTSYYSRHKTPPSLSVLEELLDKSGDEKRCLNHIRSEKPEQNEIGHILDKIKERYNKFLANSIVKKVEEVKEETLDIKDLNSDIKRIVAQTEKLYKHSSFSEGSVSDSTDDRIRHYEYVLENPEDIRGFLSGYKELDDYTWGIKNSEMLVIGGASSSGKSLLMMNMAINAWRGSNDPAEGVIGHPDGKNVLYISLEMSKQQLEQRLDANIAGIKHRGIMRATLSPEEHYRWSKCLEFQKNYDKIFYILDMPRGTTMGEVEAKYETILGIFKPDAVFVDYLQLMKPTIGATGTDWLDVGKVSEELHEFCRKKNIPVVTAAQRKAAQKKSNGKKVDDANLEDFGRSKMIGDNAAIAIMIGNREDELLREDMELHIVKNRDGAKGTVLLKKSFDKSRIESLPDNWTSDNGDENDI
jgi:replicative DNA helicase